ncbi:MAG: hypothetical protein Q8N21_04510, partial [bacterium]|nr:hypothetical protein [bacterium]
MIFNLRTIRRILLASAILLIACFAVFELSLKKSEAAINPLLNFTGKVTDTGGVAVTDGVYNFSFGLYTTATSGTAVWSEDLTAANMFARTISGVSAGATSVTYAFNADSNDTTLRVGQYLTNATTGEYELITDYDAVNNTVSVATTTAWSVGETINNRPRTEGGVVDINMGAVSDLAGVNFNQVLYLEVAFNSETMQPRKVITPAAAAFNAAKLGNRSADEFGALADNETVIGEWSFNNPLSIATSSASTALTVRQSGAGDILNLYSGATKVFTVTAGGNLTMTGTTTMGVLTYPNYDGITNQVLSTDGSGNIVWSSTAAATPHNMLSAQHTDTTAAGAVAKGDLMTGQGAPAKWTKLALGANGYILYSDGTDALWQSYGIPFYAYFSATTTDALAQGSSNLYWSNNLFDTRLAATTTLNNLVTLSGLANVGTISSGAW